MTFREGKPLKSGVGRGYVRRTGRRQVSTLIDDDTLDRLHARAKAEETSLCEQIRLMVEWGLEAAECPE